MQVRQDKQERGLSIPEKKEKSKGKISMLDAVCYCCLILKVKTLIPLVKKKKKRERNIQLAKIKSNCEDFPLWLKKRREINKIKL